MSKSVSIRLPLDYSVAYNVLCLTHNHMFNSPRQDHVKTTNELSKSLESTRAHLQGQLRNKEAENNRLSVQIKVVLFYFPVYAVFF